MAKDRSAQQQQRQETVELARAYIGTPYLLRGSGPRTGFDCATFLAHVYRRTGVFDAKDLGIYPADGHDAESSERYMTAVMRHAGTVNMRVAGAEPGNLLLVRLGKVFSHGAIVMFWPWVIHAAVPCVAQVNVYLHPMFVGRELKLFDPWDKPDAP